MMQHIRRSAVSSKSKYTALLKSFNAAPLAVEQASADASRLNLNDRVPLLLNSGCVRRGFTSASYLSRNELGVGGNNVLNKVQHTGLPPISLNSSWQLTANRGTNRLTSIFARSFASTSDKKTSEAKKEISKVEDPFDAPTYNIPEKPVTFVEGASYTVVIVAGLAIAAATAYAALNELVFQPKEYKVFNKTLKRIQDDGQVRVRIGSPITGYGQESRNRAARQRIPHRIWKDEDGIEHIEVNFYIRGPHGAGKVFCRMFKDKVEKDWKFTSLVVQISSPSPAQLLLESYVPA